MAGFSDDFIERVRNENDIVEIISQHVTLRRQGQNLIGLCPFHTEKTPSFSVSPSKQMYYCFGCHAHGSVINFVMEIERLTFPEAVRALAERANIPLPEHRSSPRARAQADERQLLYRVNQWVTDLFHDQLLRAPEARVAREYLVKHRGLSEQLIKEMRIGYALPDWSGLQRQAERSRVPIAALAKLGLIIPRQQQKGYYDRFRGRVMIPIADARGRVVAFGGRVLDDSQPKYLNSPEHILFNKGRMLFGLHQAGKAIGTAGCAVLVEGYMDCLSAWQHGVQNVVASLGTALTPYQARLLKRYTGKVVLCYDADSAGLRAALSGMEVLQQAGLETRVAVLPPGEDPDDCLRRHGPEYFQNEVVARAQSWVDFYLSKLRLDYDLDDVSGKAQYVTAAAAVIGRLDNAVAQAAYVQRLAAELAVPESAVMAELSKQKRVQRPGSRDKAGNSRYTKKDVPRAEELEVDPLLHGCQIAETKLLSLLLDDLVGGEELLLEWQQLDVYAHPIDQLVVEILLRELQAGRPIDINHLLEQAGNAALGRRLAEIAWSADPKEENADIVARDCLGKLKQLAVRNSIQALEQRLATVTNIDARKQMLQELQALIQTQKGVRH